MLIHPDKSCLLLIDIQEKLAPAIDQGERLIDQLLLADRYRYPAPSADTGQRAVSEGAGAYGGSAAQAGAQRTGV